MGFTNPKMRAEEGTLGILEEAYYLVCEAIGICGRHNRENGYCDYDSCDLDLLCSAFNCLLRARSELSSWDFSIRQPEGPLLISQRTLIQKVIGAIDEILLPSLKEADLTLDDLNLNDYLFTNGDEEEDTGYIVIHKTLGTQRTVVRRMDERIEYDPFDLRPLESLLPKLVEVKSKADVQTQGIPESKGSHRSEWYFVDLPPADSRFKHGPVSGTLAELEKWLNSGTQPTLKRNNGESWYYIRRIHARQFDVHVDSQKKLAEVNAAKLAENERNKTKRNEAK